MIKGIFDLFGQILKLIVKGLKYCILGIAWFFTNLDLLVRDVKNNNRKQIKMIQKEEIL